MMPASEFRPVTLVAALALLFSACARQAPVESIAIDSSPASIVTSDPASSDATCTISDEPVVIIGDDEKDDSQWFSQVRGIARLSDGSIAAVDRASAQVRIYDDAGRHIRSMGSRGEGPGEFSDAFILWITPGDTLWVGDYRPYRYNVFTAQGEFVRRVNLSPEWLNPSRAGGVLDNGYTVNAREESAYQDDFSTTDTMFVDLHDPRGRYVGNLAKIPDGASGQVSGDVMWLSPLFESRAEVDALGSTIVLGHGSAPELRVLDDAFNLRMIIRWLDPARKVSGADVRAWRENYIARATSGTNSELSPFDNTRLSQERPVADEFPAMSSVRIGRDGSIWVRQYDRPREERGWLAFGGDGEFMCHMAQLPGSVWEFGADYVLLVHDSEGGAETIRMYGLTRPDAAADLAVSP